LVCPEGRRRNSLAIYFYSLTRGSGDSYEGMQQDVHWVVTTEEEKAWMLSKERKYERFMSRVKGIIIKILPPIIVDGYHYLRK
jgi:hypothetical protein